MPGSASNWNETRRRCRSHTTRTGGIDSVSLCTAFSAALSTPRRLLRAAMLTPITREQE